MTEPADIRIGAILRIAPSATREITEIKASHVWLRCPESSKVEILDVLTLRAYIASGAVTIIEPETPTDLKSGHIGDTTNE